MSRFAWILGLIGGALVLVFLAARIVTGEISQEFGLVGGVGAALLVAYLWLDRDNVGTMATSRSAVYSSGAIVLTAMALGVAVAANVLGDRYDKRWDWTQSKRYTLSEQSINIAKGLAEPVQVIGFFAVDTVEEDSFEDLVEGFAEHTDKLDLQLVDPVMEPLLAQQFAITSSFGTAVLVQGDEQQRLDADFDEEAFTNALIRLQSEAEHQLCFTSGHGERGVDDDSAEGLSAMVIKLEGQNYTARNVQPLRDGAIDSACDVLIVVSPRVDFVQAEREMLARWVAEGRALMVLVDPFDTPLPFAQDLARYGVAVGDDVVLEENPNYQLMGGDISYLVLDEASYDLHPIVRELQAISVLRLARSVGAVEGFEGAQVQVLARSSERSWAETQLLSGEPPAPDEGVEQVGDVGVIAVAEITDPAAIQVGATTLPSSGLELQIGQEGAEVVDPAAEDAAAEDPDAEPASAEPASAGLDLQRAPGGRVVVFGDSDFATNELILQGENQDLFMNAVAWLVGEEEQISVRANEAKAGTLEMTQVQFALIVLFVLLGVPALCLAGAFFTWWRRRRL